MKIQLNINAKIYDLDIPADERLIDTLRKRLNITSMKEGCGEGECGACSVLMNGKSVTSCIILAAQAQGKKIITVEGICENELKPIKDAYIANGAVQCGFCIPGFIISTKALLDVNPTPTRDEVKEALAGNICRCTGYIQIIEAVMDAAKNYPQKQKA